MDSERVDWRCIVEAAASELLRNRLMVGLAYDGALRREGLVGLEVGDFEPAYSLIHLRAETTKSKDAREVTYGGALRSYWWRTWPSATNSSAAVIGRC